MLVWPFLSMENEEVMTGTWTVGTGTVGTVGTVETVETVETGININLPRLEL